MKKRNMNEREDHMNGTMSELNRLDDKYVWDGMTHRLA